MLLPGEERWAVTISIALTNALIAFIAWDLRHAGAALLWVVGLHAVRMAANAYLGPRRASLRGAGLVLYTVNSGAVLAVGQLASWSLAAWLLVGAEVLTAITFAPATWRARTLIYGLPFAALGLDAWHDRALSGPPAYVAVVIGAALMLDLRRREVEGAMQRIESDRQELDGMVSALRRTRDALIRERQLSGIARLAAAVGHGVNNPVSCISANVGELARVISETQDVPEEVRAFADEALPDTFAAIRRVNEMVADLARLGEAPRDPGARYDLNAQVRIAARLIGTHPRAACEVVLLLADGLPPGRGSGTQIAQLALNLLSICIEATVVAKVPARIEVRTRQEDDLVLEVTSTGTINARDIGTSALRVLAGTGLPSDEQLDLLACHGIVADHGGWLELASPTGPSYTPQVRVRLPRAGVDGA